MTVAMGSGADGTTAHGPSGRHDRIPVLIAGNPPDSV